MLSKLKQESTASGSFTSPAPFGWTPRAPEVKEVRLRGRRQAGRQASIPKTSFDAVALFKDGTGYTGFLSLNMRSP